MQQNEFGCSVPNSRPIRSYCDFSTNHNFLYADGPEIPSLRPPRYYLFLMHPTAIALSPSAVRVGIRKNKPTGSDDSCQIK